MWSFHLTSPVFVGQYDELTALQDIPAMQRRRLSPLAKIALHAARTTLAGQAVDYIVWTSVCGDEKITAEIMTDIAHGQTPSPTQFSVSVHNAISGLYSILYKDDTRAVSLSSSPMTAWSDALFETYAFLKTTGKQRALIMHYDAPLPALYESSYGTAEMFAIGVIMSLDEPNCTILANGEEVTSPVSAKEFYAFWQSDEQSISDGRWVYQK